MHTTYNIAPLKCNSCEFSS